MLKSIFDFLLAFIASCFFFIPFCFICLLVRFKLGTPIFFIQSRPGKGGKVFKMIKFRSMRDTMDKNGKPLPDDKRLTRFGKLLRSSSLDELPGLINVLKGDMSLVGPRPLLVEYLPRYNERQLKRHNVRPGITGWAQVNGRNAISWEQKFELDVWYVENCTLLLDVKILFMTVLKVLKRSDISSEGSVTMDKFTGSEDE